MCVGRHRHRHHHCHNGNSNIKIETLRHFRLVYISKLRGNRPRHANKTLFEANKHEEVQANHKIIIIIVTRRMITNVFNSNGEDELNCLLTFFFCLFFSIMTMMIERTLNHTHTHTKTKYNKLKGKHHPNSSFDER